MKDNFKKLKPKEAPPEDLRKEVFDSLDSLKLVADLLDLFVIKYSQAEIELLQLMSKDDNLA